VPEEGVYKMKRYFIACKLGKGDIVPMMDVFDLVAFEVLILSMVVASAECKEAKLQPKSQLISLKNGDELNYVYKER
jgi:hypothetical protein